MKKVIVHIDRLVLNGFDGSERDAIAEGLQSELGRLLRNPEAADRLATARHTSNSRIGSVRISHDANTEGIGATVSSGIVRKLLQ